jgi:hypothetical protein
MKFTDIFDGHGGCQQLGARMGENPQGGHEPPIEPFLEKVSKLYRTVKSNDFTETIASW